MEQWPRRFVAPGCIAIVTAVGLLDYLTGYETFFFIFYLVAVFLAVWFVNTPFGVLISALSVTAWISSNIEAGARYATYFVPVWNALIMFVFYLVVVWLLAKVRHFNRELEQRVRLRTESLAKEIRERMRLQKELLETSEHERRRIGHELHDSLCQQLTGAALAGQLTSQKLADQSSPQAAEVGRLVEMIEHSIELTRALSRSLSPVEWQTGRLVENFREQAANACAQFKVDCKFECHELAALPEVNVASQFYHIAAEAIANAVRHGHARNIRVCLECTLDEQVLSVTDDGAGLPEHFEQENGMGLRLMAYRADLIGAKFHIERAAGAGTRVTCALLNPSGESKNHVE